MEQSPPIGQRPRLLLQGGGGGFKLSPFEIITLLVVLGVAVYGGYSAYASFTHLNKAPPAAQTFAPVVRTTLTSTVSATGTINSSQQVSLTFDVGQGGGKIAQFFAKLGDQVVAGQPLAKLDDSDLQQSLKSAQSNLASSQARLSAVTSPATADRAAAQQAIASAQSQQTNAQKALDDLLAGPKPADQLSAQQAVLSAQAALQSAQTNLQKGQSQIQTDQISVNQAQSDFNAAQGSTTSAQSTLSAAASNVAASLSSCGPIPFIPAPSGIGFGGQVLTMPPLPFGFHCSSDTPVVVSSPTPGPTGAAGSTAAQSDVSSRISAYNSAAGAYNSAAAGIQQKQNAVTNAQTILTNDRNNIQNLQSAVDTAGASLSTAQQKNLDTLAPPKQSDIDAAKDSLDASKKSLEAAQARYDQLLNPKPDTVLPLQASVDSAAAQVETAKKLLAAATITAPFDGQISQLNGDVGTQIASNTVVFILLNPRTLRLDANVDQSYVSDLKPGESGTVTFDALPGRSYDATITAVGLTPTVQQGVVSYIVTLGIDTTRIPAGTPIPTPGMTATINVLTSRTPNALSVPTRAVRRIGRNQTVTAKTATGSEQRTVTTGATNGTLLQITSGLTDNDQVLVGAPAAPAAAARPGTGAPGAPR